MADTFVPTVERYTGNLTPGPRTYRNIFIHATRGKGVSLDAEYTSTTAWMMQAGTPSAHFVIGPTEITRMVKDGNQAWHAEENNVWGLAIEVAQPDSLPPFVDFQYRAAAAVCRAWCELYGIPKVRVMSQTQRGIIGHQDSEQGKRWGKTDPGGQWRWDYFLALVNDTGTGATAGLTDAQKAAIRKELDAFWHIAGLLKGISAHDIANVIEASVVKIKQVGSIA